VGWAWQVPWLAAAALCVGVGELVESSSYIWALRWGTRRQAIMRVTRPHNATIAPDQRERAQLGGAEQQAG
jgi:hypothetical protein